MIGNGSGVAALTATAVTVVLDTWDWSLADMIFDGNALTPSAVLVIVIDGPKTFALVFCGVSNTGDDVCT